MSGYGMNGHIMMQTQGAFGATTVTSLEAINFVSESLVHGIEDLTEANMHGRIAASPHHQGGHSVSGGISAEAEPATMGHFLRSVMGTVDTTSGTGTQTHVFESANCGSEFSSQAANAPLTMYVYRPTVSGATVNSAFVYYDMLANDMTINIANGQLVTMDTNFVGAGFTRVAKTTPTFPTGKPFLWDQFSGSFNTKAITDLQDMTVSINNNLEASWTLTVSKAPDRIKRTGQQTINITGNMVFAAHSYMQAFEAGSELPLKLNFANAASPHELLIEIDKFRLSSFDPVMGGPGLISASFAGEAMYSADSATAVTITLVNTQATYD